MPSTSKKQHNFMEMIAHDPKKAKQLGIKQSVGKDFVAADKGKKFGTGGDVNYSYGGKGQANKQRTRFGSSFGYKLNAPDTNNDKYMGLKAGGSVRTDLQKVNEKKTNHGQTTLFKEGGKAMKHDDEAQDKVLIKKMIKQAEKKEPKEMCGGGKAMKKMATGGSVKASKMGSVKSSPKRDGIAVKGKTKGRVC